MEVNIFTPDDDASVISGFTIVVDVFRAFSTAYYINNNNPKKYIISDSIEHSFNLKKTIPGALLIGEREGLKINGFDFGNSPTEINGKDFSNNTIIHTTTKGTKGLLKQPPENEVVVGSFVNTNAMYNYIKTNEISKVNIYCTANEDELYGEEDYQFAYYFKNKLEGTQNNFDDIVLKLRNGSGIGFVNEDFAPYSDFLYCLDISRFNSILKRKIVHLPSHSIELETLI